MLLLNASGCLDALTAPDVARSLDAFVTKTVTPEPREGNPPVRIAETDSGMLNSIGLANPGRERFLARDAARAARARRPALGLGRGLLRPPSTPRRARARRRDDRAEPLLPERRRGAGVGRGDRRRLPGATAAALREALAGRLGHRRECARAVEAAGADGLSLVNTMRGLALDARLRPTLARGAGGYSGPALKPVALAAVYAAGGRRAADRRHGRGADRTRRARA